MATDPDAARTELKEMQRLVMASDDLDAAMRERLARQIEISVRESVVRSRGKIDRDLAAECAGLQWAGSGCGWMTNCGRR